MSFSFTMLSKTFIDIDDSDSTFFSANRQQSLFTHGLGGCGIVVLGDRVECYRERGRVIP